MVNKKARGQRHRGRHSPLAAHKKQGGKFLPPMRQIDNLKEVPWFRDVFPDMLWLCSLIGADPDAGLGACAKALDLITDAASPHLEPGQATPLPQIAGMLTQLEALPHAAREAVLSALLEQGFYPLACPDDFAHTLALYPDAPGSWLLGPWRQQNRRIDWERAWAHLGWLAADAANGHDPLATAAKFIFLRAHVRAGRIHVRPDSPLPELLARYPSALSADERVMAECESRAMFLGLLGLDGSAAARLAWAQAFWRKNWSLFPCKDTASRPSIEHAADLESLSTTAESFRTSLGGLDQSFRRAALADPDLYCPDRYEVLTGIIARVLRLLGATMDSPLMWTEEYGSPALRATLEAKIVFHWLLLRDEPALYARFKDYGRGRLKLYALHVREHVDTLHSPPEGLVRYADELTDLINAESSEEFQDISIDATFSGQSFRAMAIETGLKKDYDLLYSSASATLHGDWASLDRHALEICTNPLHRSHRVPRRAGPMVAMPHLVELMFSEVSELVDRYSACIGTSFPGR